MIKVFFLFKNVLVCTGKKAIREIFLGGNDAGNDIPVKIVVNSNTKK